MLLGPPCNNRPSVHMRYDGTAEMAIKWKTVAIASWKITSYDHLKIIDHLSHFFDSCFLYNGEEYSIDLIHVRSQL
jgi:hypothetical protein